MSQEEGKPVVHLRLPIEPYYRSMLEGVEAQGSSRESRFLAHVQAIVWGAFYIEATVNSLYRKFVERKVIFYPRSDTNVDVADVIWEMTRRDHIRDKLEAMAKLLELDEEDYERRSAEMEQLYELRNRLVHYKEKPVKLTLEGASDFSEAHELANRAETPDARIIEDLLKLDLDERKTEILELGDWLETTVGDAIP